MRKEEEEGEGREREGTGEWRRGEGMGGRRRRKKREEGGGSRLVAACTTHIENNWTQIESGLYLKDRLATIDWLRYNVVKTFE